MNELLKQLRTRLAPYYSAGEADAIIFLLLEVRFGISRLDIYMRKDRKFSEDESSDLENILQRLCKMEPIQYILGECSFHGLTFHVEHGVLIPRPETEELVDWIESSLENPCSRIVDIGCGSGCIALTLAHDCPQTHITAFDVSPDALRIAQYNAEQLKLKISTQYCDILKAPPLPNPQYEIIVSNPPYICEQERKDMEKNVLLYEPEIALFVPDSSPLLFYERIAEWGCHALTDRGQLFFEINRMYGTEIMEMLYQKGYKHVELRKDLYGNDRMIKAIW